MMLRRGDFLVVIVGPVPPVGARGGLDRPREGRGPPALRVTRPQRLVSTRRMRGGTPDECVTRLDGADPIDHHQEMWIRHRYRRGLLQAWRPQLQVSNSETAGTEMPMVVTPISDDQRFCDEPDPLWMSEVRATRNDRQQST
jgi:hypothetical protein